MAVQNSTPNNGIQWPQDPAWQRAVQLAGEAVYQQPRYRPVINHGMELALEHAVMCYPDETTAVMDNGVRFVVDPACDLCDCDWEGFGQSLCSHLAAVAITAYAQRHLELKLQPLEPSPFGWPESTLCIKSSIPGVELSWTLRGDDSEMAERAQRVLRYVATLQAQPPKQSPVSEASPAEPPAETVAEAAAEPAPMMKWCDAHNCNAKRRGQEGDFWYSHKLPGGKWCRLASEAG